MFVTFFLPSPPPTPLLAPVEQMSLASSQISRLHTCGNTIWVHASAVHVFVRVCVGYVIRVHKYTMCISKCNCVCVIYMYKYIFIHLCVRVCCRMCVCVLLVMEGVKGSRWCCGQTARCTCVCVRFLFFFRSLLVCLCVCVACLHTPHLDRNSQLSFVCGRWDPLENQIHTVPKSHILYSLHPCSLIPQSLLFAFVSLSCEP